MFSSGSFPDQVKNSCLYELIMLPIRLTTPFNPNSPDMPPFPQWPTRTIGGPTCLPEAGHLVPHHGFHHPSGWPHLHGHFWTRMIALWQKRWILELSLSFKSLFVYLNWPFQNPLHDFHRREDKVKSAVRWDGTFLGLTQVGLCITHKVSA